MTMPGPASHTFFSQRLRLHYVDWGNPDQPPLLMIHGGRDHCRNWDWAAATLRHDWHIIAPDLRGHGDSQWSADGNYGMNGYIYDLAQLIHGQRLAPVTIIAHSLGGNVALRYAGLYPETPDHHAIIGEDPTVPGLFHCVGFGGHGLMHAPAAGRAIRELVTRGRGDTFDLRPLRPSRFVEGLPASVLPGLQVVEEESQWA
jgi:pimeloyl-ACP methyl ester carboxylesterase